MHTNLFHIVLLYFFITSSFESTYSQEIKKKNNISENSKDSVSAKKDNKISETSTPIQDSTKTDSTKQKKTFLEGDVKYKANKYTKINQQDKTITLYDNAELYYQDIELHAGVIVMDYQKNELHAGRIKNDSTGEYSQLPKFKQGTNEVQPDSIRFNYKTKKALTWNSRTEQADFKVKATLSKKENDSVYFLKRARFTTSKDEEHPEYYFQTNKVKFVPGKKIVTGLTYMVIVDVPTPLGLPFGYFPMTEKRAAGIIVPSYNDSNDKGFSLQNGGYYFPISDNYDLTVYGDYYTNGSYGLRAQSAYAKRYRYRGNFNLRYENNITGERGFPGYAVGKIYNIQWSHSRDSKASPNSSFSASVNMGSSTYFARSVNQVNVGSSLNNTLSSSVSYSRSFETIPQTRMSLTATHSQNTQTQAITMTLPTGQFSVDRIYPFAPSDGAKKGFFKNINLQYSLDAVNSITTTDSLFFTKKMFETSKIGFQNSIPLSTNFKILKYFNVNTSYNYKQVVYAQTIRRGYNTQLAKVEDTQKKGFDTFGTGSFSAGLGTTIYGTFKFGEDKKIQGIRHTITPSVSYSYSPSYEKYYDSYATDPSQLIIKEYTRFEGGIYGAPGNKSSSSVGFSFSNNFEAKVRDADSTKIEPKKIKLLNNLMFATSYDVQAKELKWSPMRVSGGTAFFKEKLGVNFGATLDPYAIDGTGKRIDVFNINNGGSLFRMTSANISMNYSLSSESFNGKDNKNEQGERNGGRSDDLFGSNVSLSEPIQTRDDNTDKEKGEVEFFKSLVPWNMTFQYTLTYGNNNREKKIIGNSVMISINMDITPKWKTGVSTGYDFVQKGVTFTQMRFEKDLLSWMANVSWVPYGSNSSWTFFIGMKASILQDLKYNKRNTNY